MQKHYLCCDEFVMMVYVAVYLWCMCVGKWPA